MANITLDSLFSRIESCKNALIVGHSHPDGDCIGSAVALASLIEALGGRASVIFPEESPNRLKFLLEKRSELTELPDALDDYCIIGVDLASPVQMASLKESIGENFSLRIDHHAIGIPYAKEEYIDESASAVGMIIFDLYEYALSSGKITAISDEALCGMFAAISSDTGCFKFANVSPKTHLTAARLIEHGADSARINRLLFDTKDMSQLIAEGIAHTHLESFCDGLISGIAVELSDYGDSLSIKDFETAIDIARSLRGARVAVCVKASPTQGVFRASLRSNDDTDVSKIASIFGGGGHVRAAGCSVIASSAKEALCMIVKELEKVL